MGKSTCGQETEGCPRWVEINGKLMERGKGCITVSWYSLLFPDAHSLCSTERMNLRNICLYWSPHSLPQLLEPGMGIWPLVNQSIVGEFGFSTLRHGTISTSWEPNLHANKSYRGKKQYSKQKRSWKARLFHERWRVASIPNLPFLSPNLRHTDSVYFSVLSCPWDSPISSQVIPLSILTAIRFSPLCKTSPD